jgi:hypothetical protein
MNKTLFFLLALVSFVALAKNYKTITGADLLTKGLDFRQGGLVPNERVRSPIFDYTFDPNSPNYVYSPTGRPDLKFKVPREISVTSTNSHVEQTNSSLFRSYSEIVKTDVGAFSFGVSIDVGKYGIGAGYSREYSRIQQRLSSNYSTTTRGLFYTSAYSCIAIPYPFMKLNGFFKQIVDALPATPRTQQDIEMYKLFLEYYGGWFGFQGIFGGSIRQFHFLHRRLTESRDESWIRTQINLSFRYNLFNISAGGFRNRSQIHINNFFAENTIGELVFTGGIRNLQSNNTLKEWDRSIDDEPSLLSGSYKPISDLLQNDPIKRENMKNIITKYSETGLVAPPPASLHVQNVQKVPGYQIIGGGFDPMYMQNRLPVFVHDNHGFENTNVWTNPFYPQHKFSVPSTMTLNQRTESVESNYTDVSLSKNEFEIKFSEKTTKKFAFGFGKRTREVFYYYHRYELMSAAKITMEKQLSWYSLSLKPLMLFDQNMMNKYMNPYLKIMIDSLGNDYSDPKVKAAYDLIIEYWGTQIVTGAKMGGSMKSDIYFKRELLNSYIIDIIKTTSSFSFLGFINSRGYNFMNDTRVAQWFRDNVVIENSWRGGRYRPTTDDVSTGSQNKPSPWEEFAATIRTDPEVLEYDILPLSVLIRDPIKKANMDKACEAYRLRIANEKIPILK